MAAPTIQDEFKFLKNLDSLWILLVHGEVPTKVEVDLRLDLVQKVSVY